MPEPVHVAPWASARGLVKRYEGVLALDRVDLDLFPGEIHALCGENGAGKSTFDKILSGSLVPEEGALTLGDRPAPFGDVRLTEALGVSIVHQESTAFPDLDAVENIFVGHEMVSGPLGLLRRGEMRARARDLLGRLGAQTPLDVPVRTLSAALRQTIGIARALSRECRLLILDEPTAALSNQETEALFALARDLRSKGVAIVWVTHRLHEVFELADKVTVLRDGKLVWTRLVADTSPQELVQAMVGRSLATESLAPGREPGKVCLSVGEIEVREGEIVALAGLVGAGRSELARALVGLEPRDDARDATLLGKPSPKSPWKALAAGLALVPEDRHSEGLVLPFSIADNLELLPRTDEPLGVLHAGRTRQRVERALADLDVRAPSAAAPVSSLSGGNQQKVLLGSRLAAHPRVLLLDEPTRGVDVGAKAEIHRLIRRLADEGMAVLLITSDLPELLALSQRVVVLRSGASPQRLSAQQATPERVLAEALPRESATSAVAGARRARPWGLAALLVAIVAIVGIVNPAFASLQNLRDVLVQLSPTAIVACGVAFVLMAGEIDISVGSLLGFTAALAGVVCAPERLGLPVGLAVAAALGGGLAVGLGNGLLVARFGVPAIIATLAGLSVLRGLTESLMGGRWITDLPSGLRTWGLGEWLGVPIGIWTALGVAFAAWFVSSRTKFGRHVLAVGSNPEAARLAGLNVRRVKLATFAATGFLTGLAMLTSVPRLSVIDSGIGVGFELLVVTCVVVGGVSIRGGTGTILGVLQGVILLSLVSTSLIFLRLGEASSFWEKSIQGALILAAVLVEHLRRRK